ncbi:MAG: hypothetical protein H3C59_16065 [Burkholderiaceae bacterium]|nr:hypothetical protein [Burkholderiaceae bacterium]
MQQVAPPTFKGRWPTARGEQGFEVATRAQQRFGQVETLRLRGDNLLHRGDELAFARVGRRRDRDEVELAGLQWRLKRGEQLGTLVGEALA